MISSQAARCREILKKLTGRPAEADALLKTLSLSDLAKEIAEPFQSGEVGIEIISEALNKDDVNSTDEPLCVRNPGVMYGLGNLIENAIDYAEARIVTNATIKVRINGRVEADITVGDMINRANGF